jgi:hypothetical protein
MSALHQTLADYLAVRRALGYKLERAEKLLRQFLDYLQDENASTVTIEHALSWATAPASDPWWHALRLNAVRPFAVYLHARDPRHEVPQIYVHADLALKERALARTTPMGSPPGRYQPTDTIITFLDNL